MLAEALDLRGEDEYDEDDGVSSSSDNLWKEQIPLLSGSVRYGGHERAWAGRTVEVGKVVAKWCKFMQLGREG